VERILSVDSGMLTIVTDNLWYGKLLVHILYEELYTKKTLKSLKPYQIVDSGNNSRKRKNQDSTGSAAGISAWNFEYFEEDIILYEGEPGITAGHSVSQASSYFDR
jgi:hypothetical protein